MTSIREFLVHRREGGGTHPQGTINAGEHVLNGRKHRLRRESAEGLTAHKQRRTVGLVHEIQLGANRPEQCGGSLLSRFEAGKPVQGRRHVRVLQRGRGAVAAREELEGLDLPLVDPARTSGSSDEDNRARECSRAAQLSDDSGDSLFDAVPTRGQTGVDADRFHGLASAHLRDVEAGGTAPKENAPLPAHGFPGNGGRRGRRAFRNEWLVDATRGTHVHLFGLVSEETDAATQDDFRRQEKHDDKQDGDASNHCGREGHVLSQVHDEGATHTAEPLDDSEERPCDDDRTCSS